MKILTFKLAFHWGHSIKLPTVSKAQPSLRLPPPSSIIGAISMPLARLMGLGEVMQEREKIYSTASFFAGLFRAASCRFQGSSTYWEDINRSLILQFQQPSRRGLPNFSFGAIPFGKIYCPASTIDFAMLVDEIAARTKLGESWEDKLQLAAWQIVRIGSKESITSTNEVNLVQAKLTNSQVQTNFYFPSGAATPAQEAIFHHENFWHPEWTFGTEAKQATYIVPGLSSLRPAAPILVQPKRPAYISDDVTLFEEAS